MLDGVIIHAGAGDSQRESLPNRQEEHYEANLLPLIALLITCNLFIASQKDPLLSDEVHALIYLHFKQSEPFL